MYKQRYIDIGSIHLIFMVQIKSFMVSRLSEVHSGYVVEEYPVMPDATEREHTGGKKSVCVCFHDSFYSTTNIVRQLLDLETVAWLSL